MTAGRLTRIYPPTDQAAPIEARDAYAELDFTGQASEDRPYVVVNMVATADGQGRIGKDTSDLGDEADAALFATLRERVDCVMAGMRTIAIEEYNAPAAKDETQHRRERAGLAPRPLVATATLSGKLPDVPMLHDPELRIVVFSEAELDVSDVSAEIVHVRTTDAGQMLAALRGEFGVRSLLLEGGPHINQPFFAGEFVDELFLTLAPVLTGSDDPFPIIAGALPRSQNLHLVSILSGEEHLYLRYRVD
jgi:riboflavin biosynthesis pyrimidine reductase